MKIPNTPPETSSTLELNETVGDHELCAWRVRAAWIWLQTRVPEASKVLARRSAFRVVAYGVGGGYLRTFEAQMTLAQAESLILRLRTDCLQKTIEKQGVANLDLPQVLTSTDKRVERVTA